MIDRKRRKKDDLDPDLFVDILLSYARRVVEKEKERDKLREEILSDAEIVARWNSKTFYIS